MWRCRGTERQGASSSRTSNNKRITEMKGGLDGVAEVKSKRKSEVARIMKELHGRKENWTKN